MAKVINKFSIGCMLAFSIFGFKSVIKYQKYKMSKLPGNQRQYATISKDAQSTLSDKKILFLGSSVTQGAAAKDKSFVEFLGEATGAVVIKESRSGTTLVDDFSPLAFITFGSGASYINRLKKVDSSSIDALVVQLSTNDASLHKPLGSISQTKHLDRIDKHTITGAIEYIVSYAKTQLDVPIIFYTNAYYEDESYQKMVARLYELQEKWHFDIIDLYTDQNFNDITTAQRHLFMFDKIHPTQAGYRDWWLPKIKTALETYL